MARNASAFATGRVSFPAKLAGLSASLPAAPSGPVFRFSGKTLNYL
jgi:hypothetical protein